MNTRIPTRSATLRLLLQLVAGHWLRRRIGGGKFCRLAPLLLLAFVTLGACTTDPTDPETSATRAAADSTDAAGSPAASFTVDPDWDGINEYDFDGNPVITIPDSVPEGDAGDAA